MQKRPSSTSSNPELPIFMPSELIDLCYVGKSAPIRMTIISIKLNKYSLRYYSLNILIKTNKTLEQPNNIRKLICMFYVHF